MTIRLAEIRLANKDLDHVLSNSDNEWESVEAALAALGERGVVRSYRLNPVRKILSVTFADEDKVTSEAERVTAAHPKIDLSEGTYDVFHYRVVSVDMPRKSNGASDNVSGDWATHALETVERDEVVVAIRRGKYGEEPICLDEWAVSYGPQAAALGELVVQALQNDDSCARALDNALGAFDHRALELQAAKAQVSNG